MYESPISLITQEVYEKTEEMIYRAVTKVGVDVDKEELVKYLQYDRNQYDKAFREGYNKAIDDFADKAIKVVFEANNRDRNPKPRDMVADIHYKLLEIAEQLKACV